MNDFEQGFREWCELMDRERAEREIQVAYNEGRLP